MSPAWIALVIHLVVGFQFFPLVVTIALIIIASLRLIFTYRIPGVLIFTCFSFLALLAYKIQPSPIAFSIIFIDSFLLWLVLSWENSPGDLKHFLRDLLKNGAQLSLVIGLLATLFFSIIPSSPIRGLLPSSSSAMIGLGSGQEIMPGQQDSLATSGKTAFIVKTEVELPPDRLYWRANSLISTHDGMCWFHRKPVRNRISDSRSEVKQKVILFAHQSEVPVGLDSPSRVEVISENLMMAGTMKADPDLPEPDTIERRPLRITDPLLLKKFSDWKPMQPGDEFALRDRILQWYSTEFRYTLSPGKIESPRLANFLLRSKQGYCEHFAASFSAIMRHLGVPSRVISGYRGGRWNPISRSYRVDEDDAHAWSEFWSERDRRWIRVDPSQVVPGAMPPKSSRMSGWLEQVYEAFISEIRLFFEENPGTALIISLTLFFAFLSLILAVYRKKADPQEKVLSLYRSFCRQAERAGVIRSSTEGPYDFGTRLQALFPEQNERIRAFTELYLFCRYGKGPIGQSSLKELRNLLGKITFRVSINRDS